MTSIPSELPASVSVAPRRRLLLGLGVLMLALDSLLRVVLLVGLDQPAGVGQGAFILLWGMLNDVLIIPVLLLPVVWFLGVSGGSSLRHAGWRFALLTVSCGGLLFGVAVEYSFWSEFTSRFNHIAIDYLLFPGEVATNIWQSYNVPAYVAAALLLGALLAWPLHRSLRGAEFTPLPWSRRLLGISVATLVAIITAGIAWLLPAQPISERVRNEVAANSQAQLVRAFATANLSYEQFYHTLPSERAVPLADVEFARPQAGDPQRIFTAAVRRDRPLDVVVVLEESLGSEFVGRLGGPKPNTPGFDRWSERGLLLTNLMANGNRTVRGLEGVLCSFMPLPGESVWKRNKSENVATIARVLRSKGYRSEFFYGGAGIFDGMKPFALANGWEKFIEDGLVASDFPPEAFRTAWGAADGYVFDRLLEHQRDARATGVPFFGTLLTTSNHKPFLTPNTHGVKISSAKAWRMAATAAGLVLVVILCLVFIGRRIGRLRIIVIGGVVLAAYGVYMSVKLQPFDSREHAVRYADQALTAYLDRAAAEGFLEHTVLLVVGDHGARVYGSAEIPAASYRIPGLLLAPDAQFHGKTIDTLASQVDLVPTLLSLAGVDYRAPFLGRDLLTPSTVDGRAWLIHNRDIGLLTDQDLVVLGLRKSLTWYHRSDRTSDAFDEVPAAAVTPAQRALAERAAAAFQEASRLYENRAYRLTDAHP
jgi:phosphoglycerol transferase MdoB-like AlkP superfamily enzyme